MKEMDDVPDGVKTLKKAFGAGLAIAAFFLPILVVFAMTRRSTSKSE